MYLHAIVYDCSTATTDSYYLQIERTSQQPTVFFYHLECIIAFNYSLKTWLKMITETLGC